MGVGVSARTLSSSCWPTGIPGFQTAWIESVKILIYLPNSYFTGGRGGDEGPAHERDYGSSACVCANEYEVLWVDRSTGAHVDGVHRDDEDAHVPRLHVNARARGARSNAAILQK